jgi:NAD(P)-dependent dehydrogenase (short-subunit alcohol dehydrogenase family)
MNTASAARNVLIFGGTSGINLGIAEAFAKLGDHVGVVSRKQDKVDAAVQRLRGLGAEAFGAAADVRVARFGAIDVLVSGAAGNFPAAAAALSPNGFKTVIDIDLMGTFHVMRAAHAHLRKPGASIVSISAPQAMVPMVMQAHVCAAKAGVDMITRTLALEWGPEGVRINSVIPGPIDGTEGMARLTPTAESRAAVIAGVPLRRYGTIADVADVVLFLASDAARYITGVVLPVDGGWCAAGAHMPAAPVMAAR